MSACSQPLCPPRSWRVSAIPTSCTPHRSTLLHGRHVRCPVLDPVTPCKASHLQRHARTSNSGGQLAGMKASSFAVTVLMATAVLATVSTAEAITAQVQRKIHSRLQPCPGSIMHVIMSPKSCAGSVHSFTCSHMFLTQRCSQRKAETLRLSIALFSIRMTNTPVVPR